MSTIAQFLRVVNSFCSPALKVKNNLLCVLSGSRFFSSICMIFASSSFFCERCFCTLQPHNDWVQRRRKAGVKVYFTSLQLRNKRNLVQGPMNALKSIFHSSREKQKTGFSMNFPTSFSRQSHAVLRAHCSRLSSGQRLMAARRVITGLLCSVKQPARLCNTWQKSQKTNKKTKSNFCCTRIQNSRQQFFFASFSSRSLFLRDIFLQSLSSLQPPEPPTVPGRLAAARKSLLVLAQWKRPSFTKCKQPVTTFLCLSVINYFWAA